MALLNAQGIARLAVELLTRTLVLPMTVSRIPGQDFAGPNGATITVRVPQPRTHLTQASPGATITYRDVDEVGIDVTVDHLYDAVHVTDEDLSLNLEDFGRQILVPMAASVANGAEDQIAGVLNDLGADITGITGTTVEASVLQARETLSTNDVPLGGRTLAVAPDFATLLLALDNLTSVDQAGSPSALREATIGRYRGFNVVESSALDPGTAVAYHASALAFGNRAPVAPRGVADSSTATQGGVSLRTIIQYDPDVLSDAVVVSTFAGASLVTEDEVGATVSRAVKLSTGS